jgi:phosphoglycerate kinase
MSTQSIKDLNLTGKRVFMRVDFNVPLAPGGKEITSDKRIKASLPSIQYALDHGAGLVLASHLGRPKGKPNPEMSLSPVAVRLSELLKKPVKMAPDCIGPEVEAMLPKPGEVLLLENLRYHAEEEKNDPEFSKKLAALCDVYVNDAFGSAHRAHASTEGITDHVADAAAGLLLEREVSTLGAILAAPTRPLVAVLGGSKVTDKIAVIRRFLELADTVLIGGAMCFPFFKVEGHAVGASMCEEEGLEPAREALALAGDSRATLRLPVDLGLGESVDASAARRDIDGVDVPEGWMGLDIGPRTATAYAQEIAAAGTVFWNGPMGVFELDAFAAGTRTVAEAVAGAPGTTVVGGGDSVAALTKLGLEHSVTHLSTGGGATLELIEGRTLPGVEALERFAVSR